MEDFLIRTETLIGKENISKLKNARILLFGLGGVGGYVLESLIRSGIEHIDVVDNDSIDKSNINRQILATNLSVGKHKVDVAIERAKSINKNIDINGYKMFFLPENSNKIDFLKYDFVIDAIDTITAKLEIAKICHKNNILQISCMGTGNRLDGTNFKITDIYKTNYCKVSKIMRKLCKENNIEKLTVLFGKEECNKNNIKSRTPASISYVPAIAGLMISQYVIEKIIKG